MPSCSGCHRISFTRTEQAANERALPSTSNSAYQRADACSAANLLNLPASRLIDILCHREQRYVGAPLTLSSLNLSLFEYWTERKACSPQKFAR